MERQRIVLSIKPQFADAIFNGTKRVELRRRRPTITKGAVAYVYSSSPQQAIVGEFVFGDIHEAPVEELWERFGLDGNVTLEAFTDYFAGSRTGYAIEVRSPRRWRSPLDLRSIRRVLESFHPPQFYRRLRQGDRLHNLIVNATGPAVIVPR